MALAAVKTRRSMQILFLMSRATCPLETFQQIFPSGSYERHAVTWPNSLAKDPQKRGIEAVLNQQRDRFLVGCMQKRYKEALVLKPIRFDISTMLTGDACLMNDPSSNFQQSPLLSCLRTMTAQQLRFPAARNIPRGKRASANAEQRQAGLESARA